MKSRLVLGLLLVSGCGGNVGVDSEKPEPGAPIADRPSLDASRPPPDAGAEGRAPRPQGEWHALSQELACTGHTATRLMDGRVLVVGSCSLDGAPVSALLYDVAADSFLVLDGIARRQHSATLLPDGRVLLISGVVDDQLVASAALFDPATASFSPAASLATARSGHTAVLLADGRVLVAGGWVSYEVANPPYTKNVEIWSESAGFVAGPSLPELRSHIAAVRLGENVMLFGGGTPSVARLDPPALSWTTSPGFVGSESVTTVVQVGDLVLCLSESEGAFSYDPTSGSHERLADTPVPHRAAAPVGEHWLVLGGSYYALAPIPVLFTPSEQYFTPAGLFGSSYYDVTATALSDESALVVGETSQKFSLSAPE